MNDNLKLDAQLRFALEIDRLKEVYRQTRLLNTNRRENSAEHSWHLAVLTMVLRDYSEPGIDSLRVLHMVLVHDIVEIDAGDTYCYDEIAVRDQKVREQEAATRIFGILPDGQAREFRELWDEFECRETPEAKFAHALDRLQPLLHNYHTQGKSWLEHGVRVDQVLDRNRVIKDGSERLWREAERMINDATGKGWLARE